MSFPIGVVAYCLENFVEDKDINSIYLWMRIIGIYQTPLPKSPVIGAFIGDTGTLQTAELELNKLGVGLAYFKLTPDVVEYAV